jgi:YVTN family beta-propeller protein
MSAWTSATRWTIVLAGIAVAANIVAAQTPETPSPSLLVVVRTNKGVGAMQILDPATGKLVGSVPVGEDPHGVAASADGKFAYVANDNGCSLSVIDLAARKEVRRIDLGPGSRPHDVQVAGGKVYFTLEGYKAIARYDPATARTDWMVGTGQNGTHMLVVGKDMSRIFTANNASESVSAIERAADGSPNWNVTVIPVAKSPEGVELSADGKELWVASKDDGGGISVIDIASRKVAALGVKTTHANRMVITPDGKLVLVRDSPDDLIVIDAATRKELKRIKLHTTSLLVTPDGSRAYATVHPDNHVAVIDLKTLTVTGRIETGSALDPDELAWVERK